MPDTCPTCGQPINQDAASLASPDFDGEAMADLIDLQTQLSPDPNQPQKDEEHRLAQRAKLHAWAGKPQHDLTR